MVPGVPSQIRAFWSALSADRRDPPRHRFAAPPNDGGVSHRAGRGKETGSVSALFQTLLGRKLRRITNSFPLRPLYNHTTIITKTLSHAHQMQLLGNTQRPTRYSLFGMQMSNVIFAANSCSSLLSHELS